MAKFLLNDFIIEDHVKKALLEDIGYGDISTDSICCALDSNAEFEVFLTTRSDGVFCGKDVFQIVFSV